MKLLILALLSMALCVNSANILGVFYFYSSSHYVMGETIFKALAKRGHDVTMISGFKLKKSMPGYTEIHMPELMGNVADTEALMLRFLEHPNQINHNTYLTLLNETRSFTEAVFKNEKFQKLVESGKKFDVIVLEQFFNRAHVVLSHVFQAPIIYCGAGGLSDEMSRLTYNPIPYAYVPSKVFPYSDEMTFIQRFINTFVGVFGQILRPGLYGHEEIAQKYFPDAPSLAELEEKNVALILSNGHFSFETPRPYVPSVINVGGFHVEEPKPLPKDLQKYLDDAKDGAIYFSLGSNIKSTMLKDEMLNQILKAFGRTNLKVLMKWEKEELPNKPGNVEVKKWFPQNDILAHPNVKVFITHGGLFSTIEAIYHAKPVIGIPVFADQISNVPRAVVGGYGLQVDFLNLTEDNLSAAINEMVSNSKYTENIKKRSQLLKFQPIHPLDSAVFWVEHVIHHKGGAHLQTKARTLAWYQLLLLDIVGFVASILLAVFLLFYIIYRRFISGCCDTKPKLKESTKRRAKRD